MTVNLIFGTIFALRPFFFPLIALYPFYIVSSLFQIHKHHVHWLDGFRFSTRLLISVWSDLILVN